MNKFFGNRTEYYEGAKTPEEAFDRRLYSENYRLLLRVALFLIVGAEGFVGIMPAPTVIGVACFVAFIAGAFLAGPLFWEVGQNGRGKRRISRAAYFPIRLWPFIISKWKLMCRYGAVLWLFSLAIQLIFGILLGFGNILLYQGTLAAAFLGNILFYTLIGTVGARLGE